MNTHIHWRWCFTFSKSSWFLLKKSCFSSTHLESCWRFRSGSDGVSHLQQIYVRYLPSRHSTLESGGSRREG